MTIMLLSSVVFCLVWILVWIGISIVTNEEPYKLLLVGLIVCVIIGAGVGFVIEREASSKYVDSYTVAKQTIESSLDSERLTGFERAELVNQATEYNRNLAEKKYTASRWYGFTSDKRILDLDYICLP